jgi:hypothetical protein
MFAIYALVVFFDTVASCGSDQFFGITYASGGPAETLPTAGLIAAVLWAAAVLAGWRFPRRHLRLFLAFAAVYAVALVVLWDITPAVWGAGICPGRCQRTLGDRSGPFYEAVAAKSGALHSAETPGPSLPAMPMVRRASGTFDATARLGTPGGLPTLPASPPSAPTDADLRPRLVTTAPSDFGT